MGELIKITKFAQSCILVEEAGARILFDPGNYSTKQNELEDLDALFITHEHQDHYDLNNVKAILANNQNVKVYTNNGVGAALGKDGIKYSLLEQGQSLNIKGVKIDAFGEKHAMMYPTLPRVANTGYMIAERLFHPGDSLTVPNKKVEILALPIVAPWLKMSEVIDYAKAVKPKVCFPIHDANAKSTAVFERLIAQVIEPDGIKFAPLAADGVSDF